MELSRKWRIGLVLTAVLATLIGTPVFADDYPFKPITLIIPFPAGGAVDLTSRALANAAKNYLGQPIICENKAGGGGTVGPSLLITKPTATRWPSSPPARPSPGIGESWSSTPSRT
jgi:tripartite-type tricarboxylate transporter receptor subunit TctC